MSWQSGIESCRGHFTDLSRRLKQSQTRSAKKHQTRFGAGPRPIPPKATYQPLRHIAIIYRQVSVASSLRHPSRQRKGLERRWKRGGILGSLPAFCTESRRERSTLLSRYQGSLMDSRNSLTGLLA